MTNPQGLFHSIFNEYIIIKRFTYIKKKRKSN